MDTLDRYEQLQTKYLNMAKRRNLSPCTLRNYESVTNNLKNFLSCRAEKGIIGKEYVSYDDIEAWADEMTEKGEKPGTVKQKLVTAGQFFGFATKPYIPLDLRYEQSPVSPDFYPKTKSQPIGEVLSDEDTAKLWDLECRYPKYHVLNGQYIPLADYDRNFTRNYAIVTFILGTGLRNKEVLDLTLADVDFKNLEVTVRHGKGDKGRLVDLPEACAVILEWYLNSGCRPSALPDTAPLFGTTAEKTFGIGAVHSAAEELNPAEQAKNWHKGSSQWLSSLIERHVYNQTGGVNGGTRNIRSHDLRRIFARISLNTEGNIAELQSAMGHSSPNTTVRYSLTMKTRAGRASTRQIIKARDTAAEQLKKQNEAKQTVIKLYA